MEPHPGITSSMKPSLTSPVDGHSLEFFLLPTWAVDSSG